MLAGAALVLSLGWLAACASWSVTRMSDALLSGVVAGVDCGAGVDDGSEVWLRSERASPESPRPPIAITHMISIFFIVCLNGFCNVI